MLSKKSVRKHFRKHNTENRLPLFYVALVALAGAVYVLCNILDLFAFGNNAFQYSSYLRNLHYTHGLAGSCLISLVELGRNSSQLLNGSHSIDFGRDCVQRIVDARFANQEFELFITKANNTFTQKYVNVTYTNPCTFLNSTLYPDCGVRNSGLFSKGTTMFQTYLFHHLAASISNFNRNGTIYPYGNNSETLQILETLRADYHGLNGNVSLAIMDEIRTLSSSNNQLVILFIIFFTLCCLLLLALVLVPNANDFKTRIVITIKLLNMIPLNVISEIKTIRNYLMKILR